eukprot:TRINITY_DN24124_c0_g1_i1.p1 TRINITY_DN24124_c0_g1~~TRINITY_DN24124_c0_g1_i1.p1  ORF type:complete len:140 (-),score=12.88 TRINITY_DN24124_c0_g1_i1:119-538(-)
MWHRDNMKPGLTIILPFSDIDDEVGPTHILPGTHHLASSGLLGGMKATLAALSRSGGALVAAGPSLRPGDAFIFDGRLLHRGLGNSSYNRCRVVLVLRLDMLDAPPPGASVAETTRGRIFGTSLEVLSGLYGILPAPSS